MFNAIVNRFSMLANILVRFAADLKQWKNFFFQEIKANNKLLIFSDWAKTITDWHDANLIGELFQQG